MKKLDLVRENQNKKNSKSKRSESLWSDWLDVHPGSFSIQKDFPQTPQTKQFTDQLWPISQEFHRPIPALFSIQILKLDQLNRRPIWILRDGLIPLLWFFKKNPRPNGLQSRLLVKNTLAPYVPESWRGHFGTYELCSTENINSNQNKLLLVGCLSELSLQRRFSKSWFGAVKEQADQTMKDYNLLTSLHFNGVGHHVDGEFTYSFDVIQNLSRTFQKDIQSFTPRQYDALDHCVDCVVAELADDLMYTDSWMLQMALAKGAKLLGGRVIPFESENFIAFSPYHGVVVQESIEDVSEPVPWDQELKTMEQYQLRLSQAMNTEAYRLNPWPVWFGEWVQGVQSKK